MIDTRLHIAVTLIDDGHPEQAADLLAEICSERSNTSSTADFDRLEAARMNIEAGQYEHAALNVIAAEGGIQLTDLAEPVMAQFDRLPLPMQMRVAAEVLRMVNRRCASNGRLNVALENWWPTKLKEFADVFDREDYEQRVIASGLADGLDLL